MSNRFVAIEVNVYATMGSHRVWRQINWSFVQRLNLLFDDQGALQRHFPYK